jgi:hypothetical protein
VDVRFAGDQASLAELTEQELMGDLRLEAVNLFLQNREQDRMREVMRLRTDKLRGSLPGELMVSGWTDGTGADSGL